MGGCPALRSRVTKRPRLETGYLAGYFVSAFERALQLRLDITPCFIFLLTREVGGEGARPAMAHQQ